MHKDFLCETECDGAEDECAYYKGGVCKPCFPGEANSKGVDPVGHMSKELWCSLRQIQDGSDWFLAHRPLKGGI